MLRRPRREGADPTGRDGCACLRGPRPGPSPAPAGSLDATLSAAKIPLFALDVRQAPQSGPVAGWLGEAHKTRSIGALYPEDQPYAYIVDLNVRQPFDVVLFVEKPSAARKN